ncbi:hypothetical protein FRC04_012202 [Tulasnella sp. 424]|nr:hypothetical protein FRC04_012202 [Tulasnella sp. 424]KAG8970966.1 hypothetical protein FRC05_011640 [Tulasnella sp. 425]
MQQFAATYSEAELWLTDLSNNGPPNMESYGSIIQELDVLIQSQEQSRLLGPSTSQQSTDLGPLAPAPCIPAPRRALTVPEVGTPRNRGSSQPVGGLKLAPVGTIGANVSRGNKGFPSLVPLPSLCNPKPYKPATDAAKETQNFIATLNEYANSLEFVGQIGETQKARELIVGSAIPLFFLSDFVRAAKPPLAKAIQLLNSTRATAESLALDIQGPLRQLVDALEIIKRLSVEWKVMMEERLLGAPKQQDESLTEKGARYVKRNYENWRAFLQTAGCGVFLAGTIWQEVVMEHAQTILFSGASLAMTTANVIGSAGEVAQLTEKRKENCRGKHQDYLFPAMGDFVKEFSSILQDLDPKGSTWTGNPGPHLTQLADEVRTAQVVSSCMRS